MSEPLRLDQDDYGFLLDADEFFGPITVLVQHKGVTESDIEVALSTLNEKAGKIGACCIVLMPELQPDASEGPAPRYFVRIGIQAIVQPLFADDPSSGADTFVEQVTERIRQIGHNRSFGRSNTFMFDGMTPISAEAGKESYGVFFKRIGGDAAVAKVAKPGIASVPATLPATGWDVTLNVPGGATAYYTTDGSLPTALNGTAYTVPFNVPPAATVRACAVQAGFQQSEPATLVLA